MGPNQRRRHSLRPQQIDKQSMNTNTNENHNSSEDIHTSGISSSSAGQSPYVVTPDLSSGILSEEFATIVRWVASVTDTYEELSTALVLGAISSAIGKGLVIDYDDRPLPLGLYLFLLMKSGGAKTRAWNYIMNPIQVAQREMLAYWNENVVPEAEADLIKLDAQISKLKKAIEKGDDGVCGTNGLELQDLLRDKAKVKAKLIRPMLYLDDGTPARVAMLMEGSAEQMSFHSSDAGTAIQNIMGRFNKDSRPDDGLLLKGYSGDTHSEARVGRPDIVLDNPWTSLSWITQPDKLDVVTGSTWLQEGGFLARCLIAKFPVQIEDEGEEKRQIPDLAIEPYEDDCRDSEVPQGDQCWRTAASAQGFRRRAEVNAMVQKRSSKPDDQE
jgi:Protein of unknown function (DUF3987)